MDRRLQAVGVTSSKEFTQQFNPDLQEAKQTEEKVELSPPHIYAFSGWVQGLAKDLEEGGTRSWPSAWSSWTRWSPI